jgi:hypothetical protein
MIKAKYQQYRGTQRSLEINRKYGVTQEVWEGFTAFQKGLCASCSTDLSVLSGRHLAIDHDHETGLVRGILCHSCNKILGFCGDNQMMLYGVINYLVRMNPGAIK